MTRKTRSPITPEDINAPTFAALGDVTRLALVRRLSREGPTPISELVEGFKLTRQAVTRHLRVLESVGLVRGERHGREIRFRYMPDPVGNARIYLEQVARQWSEASKARGPNP